MSEDNKVIDFNEMRKKRDEVLAAAKTAQISGVVEPGMLGGLCDVIDGQDQLLKMIVNDLQVLAHKVNQLEGVSFNSGLYLENLQTVVKENVPDGEKKLRETWNRDIVPRLKELKDSQEKVKNEADAAAKAAQSKIIMPNSGIIVQK